MRIVRVLALAFLVGSCSEAGPDQSDPCDGVTVDDGIDCTVDACNPTTGAVTHTGQDSMCSDSTDCTADTCGATGCVHTANDNMCDDGAGCTVDSCSATGCVHTPNDTMCSDSASCSTDTCAPGAGADPTTGCVRVLNDAVCADSASCSTDTCAPGAGADATTGCKHVLNDSVCGDSINCTTDACAPGGTGADATTGCTHVTVNSVCEVDGKSCTVATCSATTGCTEVANNTLCNDNASCTTEVCSTTGPGATGCVVTPNNAACADTAECSTDTCAPGGTADPTTGCLHAQDMTVCDTNATCSATFDCECGAGYMGTGLACAGVPCAALSNPTNGSVAVSNLGAYPSTATYTCNLGLAPSALARTCGTDGMWSGAAPTCDTSVFVTRVGDGAAALTNGSTAVFLEERSSVSGALARTIALPTTGSSFTISGVSTTEGGLSRSTDGRFVVLGGFTAAPGLAAVGATSSATVPRGVARIDGAGGIDVSTQLNNAFGGTTGSGNSASVRGVSTVDGTAFWVTGSSAVVGTEPGGVHYVTLGSTGASTRVSGTNNNMRNTFVFGGQLYASSGSSPTSGVCTVGAGLPAVAGAVTTLFAAATPPESFALLDLDANIAGLDTLYVAIDNNGTANVLNVQKWTMDATGTWTRVTAFAPVYTGATTTTGCTRGLAVWSAADGVHVVASTFETAATKLVTFVDTGSNNTPTVTVLATAATNTGYRGVARSPNVAP